MSAQGEIAVVMTHLLFGRGWDVAIPGGFYGAVEELL
mgnify:CR=1 FL=1